ncbi:hypothetical protein BLOT_009843 [Blomia tropicalis]|nr:hypothetical protein BLOT_009843 [Blomia tropicalis]
MNLSKISKLFFSIAICKDDSSCLLLSLITSIKSLLSASSNSAINLFTISTLQFLTAMCKVEYPSESLSLIALIKFRKVDCKFHF